MSDWATPLIGAVWLAWFVLYRFVTRSTRPDEQIESSWSRASYIVPMLASAVLIAWQDWPGWLGEKTLPSGPVLYWTGFSLIVVGLGFATWARAVLGANWSGTVALKVWHELVRAGPYRWIRHPMYGGVLAAMLGSALALGRVHAFVGALVALVALCYKSRIEELAEARVRAVLGRPHPFHTGSLAIGILEIGEDGASPRAGSHAGVAALADAARFRAVARMSRSNGLCRISTPAGVSDAWL